MQEKKLEQTTLDGIKLHFDHLERVLGKDRLMPTLLAPNLQKYVDTRASEWIDPNVFRRARREKKAASPAKRAYKRKIAEPPEPEEKAKRHPSPLTIKKEIVSLRTAWNWARRHLDLREEFPGGHLDFAKTEESLPFMTWEEGERRIAAGDNPEKIRECIYLRTERGRRTTGLGKGQARQSLGVSDVRLRGLHRSKAFGNRPGTLIRRGPGKQRRDRQ